MAKRAHHVSGSVRTTLLLGRRIARRLAPGDTVCLIGELGSGKTVLAKGICRGLGVREPVTSPSFTIGTEYAGRMPVTHIDLYRLSPGEARELPIEEMRAQRGVTIIEWADRLARIRGTVITLRVVDRRTRSITIEDTGH